MGEGLTVDGPDEMEIMNRRRRSKERLNFEVSRDEIMISNLILRTECDKLGDKSEAAEMMKRSRVCFLIWGQKVDMLSEID